MHSVTEARGCGNSTASLPHAAHTILTTAAVARERLATDTDGPQVPELPEMDGWPR